MVDEIHHYCSASVFLSLIKHRQLWLTSLSQSNDHLEGTWMLEHWLDKFDHRNRMQRLKKRGARLCVEMVLRENLALGTCFSEESDLLSQWRGYAGDGSGFSVSFDVKKLHQLAFKSDLGVELSLAKIAYGYQDWPATNLIISRLHDAFGEDAEKYEESEGGGGSMGLVFTREKRLLQRSVARDLFTVKNGAFREEKEWRMFLFGSQREIRGLEFRESGGVLSPFVRMGFDVGAIVSVTLGPTNPTSDVIAQAVLDAYGVKCRLHRSTASYRK